MAITNGAGGKSLVSFAPSGGSWFVTGPDYGTDVGIPTDDFNAIELFFKTSNEANHAVEDAVYYVRNSSAISRYLFSANQIASGRIKAIFHRYIETDGTIRNITDVFNTPLEVNTWYHFVVRYNPTHLRFDRYYGKMNQIFPHEYFASGNLARNSGGTTRFRSFLNGSTTGLASFGAHPNQTFVWKGNIAEFRVLKQNVSDENFHTYKSRFRDPDDPATYVLIRMNEPLGWDGRAYEISKTNHFFSLDYFVGTSGGRVGSPEHPFKSSDITDDTQRCFRPGGQSSMISSGTLFAPGTIGRLSHMPSGHKTLEIFFKPEASPSTSRDNIFTSRDAFNINDQYLKINSVVSGKIESLSRKFYDNKSIGSNIISVSGSPLLDNEQWYHYVERFESDNKFHFYIGKAGSVFPTDYVTNSVARADSAIDGFGSFFRDTHPSGIFKVAEQVNAKSNRWGGSLSEFRMWTSQRTNSQINTFNRKLIPVSSLPSDLASYVRLNEPSGETTMVKDTVASIHGLNYNTSSINTGPGFTDHPFLGLTLDGDNSLFLFF